MRTEMYALHAALEETHWWFAARRRIVLTLLRRELRGRRDLRLLDVGCGAGGMLAYLREFGTVTGVDPSPDAVAYAAAQAGADVRFGTLPDGLPFTAQEKFDVITLLDVLEHVEADQESLRTLRTLLKPGGLLIVTVPAFRFLWTNHDVVNEHKRRYRRAELAQRLTAADFTVRTLTYFNTALFPPIAAIRVVRRLAGATETGADLGDTPAPINAALRTIFSAERHAIGRVRLPFGVSLIAAARAGGEG
jgi:2-polyprenyl-3-methyl-5-hydroxy-6-metoxy-1,4-benzoquinol methylase